MTSFQYDILLKPENICNLNKERSLLEKSVQNNEKVVIYGRRNSGKTSLVKNALIPWFESKHKKAFVLFVDLMEVKDLNSINERIKVSFEIAFSKYFPGKSLFKTALSLIANLRPQVTLDELTGNPQITLEISKQRTVPFSEVFSIIQNKIGKTHKVLVVIDEFQDVVFVPEAQGLFRQCFQQFEVGSLILMGSKQHMLANLFAKPKAPLARFGRDINFGYLPYDEYHKYIQVRLKPNRLSIDFETCRELQDLLFRDPEAINIICQNFISDGKMGDLSSKDIRHQINQTIQSRTARFEQYLSRFTIREQELLCMIGKHGPIQHPSSKDFLRKVNLTPKSVQSSLSKFMDHSVVEKTEYGYQILDPLLFYFLRKFR